LKNKTAIKGREHSAAAFEGLNANVDKVSLAEWQEEERKAMKNRGESLRIYEVKTAKGLFFTVGEVGNADKQYVYSVPSLAEIRLKLSQSEKDAGMVGGTVAWLSEGLNLEKAQ
jgi:hypothetical protein